MNRQRYALLFIAAAIVRFIWLALHADAAFAAFDQGDYRLYEIGAEHIAAVGDFSNSLFLARPPGYPMLIYLVGGTKLAVILVNSLLGAIVAPLAAHLAIAMGLRPRLALWVGAIVCIEPTSLIHGSVTLNAEPLTNAALLTMLLCALRGTEAKDSRQQYAWFIGAAIMLTLAALTRPAAHWLWLILGIMLWWRYARLRRKIVAFMFTSALLLSAWVLHNGIVFDHFTFTTTGAYTMLYYRAASVERVATNRPINEVFAAINQRVSARIGEPTEGVDADRRHHWLAAPPEVYNAMLAESMAIFRKYPLAYLLTVPVGFLRIYGIFSSFPNLGQPLLAIAWFWEISLVAGWCAGIWIAWRRREHTMVWWQFTLVSYFTVVTLLVSSASNSARMTSMITPLLIIATVYSVHDLLARRQARRGARP